MKAVPLVCITGESVPSVHNGRIARQRNGENAEIQMYLSKLKDLVPYMPKNKKLSKLEVIENVIDYICDLESTLRKTVNSSTFDLDSSGVSLVSRQPLGVVNGRFIHVKRMECNWFVDGFYLMKR